MIQKITIDGIQYYADRPGDCRACYFYKSKKTGCILGKENCYYLAENILTETEKKCSGCPYAKARGCVTVSCYKNLTQWLSESRQLSAKNEIKRKAG